ncbi:sigma-54 factor interaction domain-containing protein [bacterium AH-315-N03]|nr:sigma-54 factor interaction domain-containing protein [bacterium AH-315-N03]
MKIQVGGSVYRFETQERAESVEPSKKARFGELVGTSPAMREAFGLLGRIASMSSTVVVNGETGTGKELAARALHERSARSEGPFIVVDCGAISQTLIESELFGHERGAFTGAIDQKIGSFEKGDGGTVFLDEIGELPLELQVKLLRVLERYEIKRVGGESYQHVDVRIVAATHRDLAQMVEEGA